MDPVIRPGQVQWHSDEMTLLNRAACGSLQGVHALRSIKNKKGGGASADKREIKQFRFGNTQQVLCNAQPLHAKATRKSNMQQQYVSNT